MPNGRSVLVSSVSVPPYSGCEWRTTSPGRTKARRVVEMADMPEENSAQLSVPSNTASRSSTISLFGWLKRE